MQTVLVVDDEPIVRDFVVRYLERDGFRTLTASDGDADDRRSDVHGESGGDVIGFLSTPSRRIAISKGDAARRTSH